MMCLAIMAVVGAYVALDVAQYRDGIKRKEQLRQQWAEEDKRFAA